MPSKNRQDSSDAIAMLIADHRKVQRLFKDFDKLDRSDEDACIEIVETACAELKLHSIIEEEIFYPAVRSKIGQEGEDLLNEAAIEHEIADTLIDKLGETDPSEPDYAAYFKVLSEYVQHHIREEEKVLFPKVKKMKELDLEELGGEMQARRDELMAEIESDVEMLADEEQDEEETSTSRSKGNTGSTSTKRPGS
jgi:hemerythrin superfamily protein